MPKTLPRDPIIVGSVRAVSKFFHVNERTAGRWFDQGCPGEARKYDLYFIHKWLLERNVETAVKERRGTGDSAPDLKKRLDEVKIRKEDLLFAERSGAVLPRDHCDQAFGVIEAQLRKAGELLLKHYGEDAQDIVSESLDEAKRELEKLFADDIKPEASGA